MIEQSTIVKDLTILLSIAGTLTLVFHLLRIPILFAYIVTGLIAGPYCFPEFVVHQYSVIHGIGELGVLFLMFYIGLKFDLKKLNQTLIPSLLATSLQVVSMILLSIIVTPILGWSTTNRLFLGSILAISSTMITLSTLHEHNALHKNYAQFTISILILEDIFAIFLLVILSGIGPSGGFSWLGVSKTAFLLGIFIITVFFLGRLATPNFMKFLNKIQHAEILIVVFIAIILAISQLANSFSTALGAFLAGTLFSYTHIAQRLEQAIQPLKDIFSAIFFIAIGMSINPKLLLTHVGTILLLSLLTVFGKSIACYIGLLVSGQKPQTAFYASVPKAQIGEFSFIIAALGQSSGLTNPNLITITAGVALVSSLLTTLLVRKTSPIFNFLENKTPPFLQEFCRFYLNILSQAKIKFSRIAFFQLVRKPLAQIFVRFILINGILWSTTYIAHLPFSSIGNPLFQLTIWITSVILCSPFLITMIQHFNALLTLIGTTTFKKFSQYPHLKIFINISHFVALVASVTVFTTLFLAASYNFLPSYLPLIIFLTLSSVLGLVFWKKINVINVHMENLFLESFHSEIESAQEKSQQALLKKLSAKYPWNISVQSIKIPPQSPWMDKQILELNLRKLTGSTIIGLTRNNHTIHNPRPETHIFPGDTIILLGEDDQIKAAEALALPTEQVDEINDPDAPPPSIDIEHLLIGPLSPIVNETIASSNLRKHFQINVIGLQRGKIRIPTPKPEEILRSGDIIFFVGNEKDIQRFKQYLTPPPILPQVAYAAR